MLDLSSTYQVPVRSPGKSARSRKNPLDLQRPSDQEETTQNQDGVSLEEDAVQYQNGISIEDREGVSNGTSSSPKTSDSIQILGLESQEPIISYQGQVYQCSWATALGTDMIFTEPGTVPPSVEPLATDPKFNLLATTNIKLVAEPVELKERNLGDDAIEGPQATSADHGQRLEGNSSSSAQPEKPFSIQLEDRPTESRKRQAAFLEELMAIKAARSENDKVYIGKGKKVKVQGEENPRDGLGLGLQGSVDNAEETEQPGNSQGADTSPSKRQNQRGRGRKSRARGGKAAGRGLFRDLTKGQGNVRGKRRTRSENTIDPAVASEDSQDITQIDQGHLNVEDRPQNEQMTAFPQATQSDSASYQDPWNTLDPQLRENYDI